MATMEGFSSLDELNSELLKVCSVYQRHFTFGTCCNNLPFKLKKEKSLVKAAWEALVAFGWIIQDDHAAANVAWTFDRQNSFICYLKENEDKSTSSFAPALVNEVYAKVSDSQKLDLHAQAAGTIYETYEDDLSPLFPLLEYHYNKAGDAEEEIKMVSLSLS